MMNTKKYSIYYDIQYIGHRIVDNESQKMSYYAYKTIAECFELGLDFMVSNYYPFCELLCDVDSEEELRDDYPEFYV